MTTKGVLKTKLCKFHWRDDCRRGAECRFAHSLEELRPLPQRLSKAPFQFYDGENVPNAEDVLAVLSWGMKFYRYENLEVPKWVHDMVWDFCVPDFLTTLEVWVANKAAWDLRQGEQGWRERCDAVRERCAAAWFEEPSEEQEEEDVQEVAWDGKEVASYGEEEYANQQVGEDGEEEYANAYLAQEEEEEEEAQDAMQQEQQAMDEEEEEPCKERANLQGGDEEEDVHDAVDEEEKEDSLLNRTLARMSLLKTEMKMEPPKDQQMKRKLLQRCGAPNRKRRQTF